MILPNRYNFHEAEPKWARFWAEVGTYAFDPGGSGPIFTIDTPPPTVSGQLHIGHCYSYTQADVIARYRRMRGDRVFYPMGFDDNGLATERFVEKTIKHKAIEMGREAFIDACLDLTQQTEDRFEALWRRLGLSVDWRYRYSTISAEARRVSQWSFIQLYRAGLAYTQQAPTLWCPECQTAIAQAEVNDTDDAGTHERCGTPVEYLHTRQWFIRILDQKERFLEAGRQIRWHPEHMRIRYEHWVEHLQWDWCISRQRYFGVPFPAWICRSCGETILATWEQLPVDPQISRPMTPCSCGSTDVEPEPDIMDTWATSSCTPLILARWPDDPAWFAQHFPASMRPQAHDIIRTWAFYTIVKSLYHTGNIPWRDIMISGFGLSADRRKLSKSKEHHEVAPMEVIEQESADAMRYWATSGKTGMDSPFSPEIIAIGQRLVTKLWNASRFAGSRLEDFDPAAGPGTLLPTDRWLLSRLAQTISSATAALNAYEYAAARADIERFFWSDLCDNYLELAKSRLYGQKTLERQAAQWTLYHVLLSVLKMLAPYLPYITEEIYQGLFRRWDGASSIHRSSWPLEHPEWIDPAAEEIGKTFLELLHQVRRYKAERGLSIGAELETLHVTAPPAQSAALEAILADLKSATRAKHIILDDYRGNEDNHAPGPGEVLVTVTQSLLAPDHRA